MRFKLKSIKSFVVVVFAAAFIGCSEPPPPAPPTGEMKQLVLDYLTNQPVVMETRYGVKNVASEYRKPDVFLLTADVDTNGTVAKRKFIASKTDNKWQILPATDTNMKNLGIYKADEKK